MKRRDLLKELAEMAKAGGLPFSMKRRGRDELWMFGTQPLYIPAHREIKEGLAAAVLKDAREHLGRIE